MKRGGWKIQLVCAAAAAVLTGCASREIEELQGSVQTLESRLREYQRETSEETEFTTTSLNELNQMLNRAFGEIRRKQTGMETVLESVSNRLAAVERQTGELQTGMTRIDNQMTNNYAVLNDRLVQFQEDARREMNDALGAVRSDIASMRSDLERLGRTDAELRREIESARASLNQRIANLDRENGEMFQRILRELGAEDAAASAAPPASGGEDGVHVVRPGETLSGIAARYGASVSELQRLNGIDDPARINVGQRLTLP